MKKLSICPLGKVWVYCLKSLKKPSIYPPGKTPSAPSEISPLILAALPSPNPWQRELIGLETSRHPTPSLTIALEWLPLGRTRLDHPQWTSGLLAFTPVSSLSGTIFKRGGRVVRCFCDHKIGQMPSTRTHQYDPAESDGGVLTPSTSMTYTSMSS